MILLVRNPVERAISQYFHFKNRGYEPLSLEEAIDAEESRIGPHLANMAPDAVFRPDHPLKLYSYKARGHYAEQLKRFYQYFQPDQIMIIKSEEYFADPRRHLSEIFRFLEVNDSCHIPDVMTVNVGQNKHGVPDDLYTKLRQYFCQHNIELADLIGRDFGW